jgi:hypothetical protein
MRRLELLRRIIEIFLMPRFVSCFNRQDFITTWARAMRCRDLIGGMAVSASVWSLAACSEQPPTNIPIIGWISPATSQSYSQPLPGNPGPHQLREALAKRGLVDGKNIRIDMRLAEGNLVNSGLAASLARPGSNMTGGSILATELDSKKIEMLKELLPDAKRFGILNDPATTGPDRPREMAEIARRLGVELQSIDIRGAGDLEPAFRALESSRAEGVNVVSSAMLTSFRQGLGELSVASKVPAICQFKAMVEAGCLASYGITVGEVYSISADQISKLLKGAKPADLPVQQPTRFQFVINLGVAKTLGLSISPALLARAEEVIE